MLIFQYNNNNLLSLIVCFWLYFFFGPGAIPTRNEMHLSSSTKLSWEEEWMSDAETIQKLSTIYYEDEDEIWEQEVLRFID